MKKCTSIDEAMVYILTRHKVARKRSTLTGGGIVGYKMLRRADGRRIIFEYTKGFHIFSHNVEPPDTLILETLALGYVFKSKDMKTVSAKLYLPNLMLINIYDHAAQFFSFSGVDFAYTENSKEVEVLLLQEWVNKDPGILRAQWVNEKHDVAKLLEETAVDFRAREHNKRKRLIDI